MTDGARISRPAGQGVTPWPGEEVPDMQRQTQPARIDFSDDEVIIGLEIHCQLDTRTKTLLRLLYRLPG